MTTLLFICLADAWVSVVVLGISIVLERVKS